jgi:LuxR family transcriptional regulator, activator of conjugal transfer of Ti plasmids
MYRVFQMFIDRLNESGDANSFQSAMADAAQAFDLPCFAYLLMPRDGRAAAALISSYPVGWTGHYLRQHYERFDPVIVLAHQRTEPFEWGLGADGMEMNKDQARLFDEASEFGIRCGLTVPIQDGRGPVAAVTFASDAPRPAFLNTIQSNKRVLQLMAISLHAHARRRLYGQLVTDNRLLTARELECLRFAADGKSAWETAQVLNVTERTVTFHIENARRKLGVRTKMQAIAKLASLNALRPR